MIFLTKIFISYYTDPLALLDAERCRDVPGRTVGGGKYQQAEVFVQRTTTTEDDNIKAYL